ncbi:hypothetical protein [Spirosoma gilvum]
MATIGTFIGFYKGNSFEPVCSGNPLKVFISAPGAASTEGQTWPEP